MHRKTLTGCADVPMCALCISDQMPGICICILTASTPHAATGFSVRCMLQGSRGPGGAGGFLFHHPPSSPHSPPPPPSILNSTPKHSLSLPKHCGLYTAGRSCLNQQSPRWQDVHSHCESRQPGQYPAGSCNIRYGVLIANTCKCGASCSEGTHAWPTNRSSNHHLHGFINIAAPLLEFFHG